MIYDASTLDFPAELRADLCVVGSGAGGAMVAMVAAEAGLDVVMLEAGAFVPPESVTQREEQMIPQLLWDHGGRTTADRAVAIHQGRALGGSTMHNLNLCKRIPSGILAGWRRDRGLSLLPQERWDALYTEVERMLEVSVVPEARWNRHNHVLRRGTEELGWEGGGLSHNRTGCRGSGFCELGCPYNAKQNALKILIPDALDHGARVVTDVRVSRIVHDGHRATGVIGAAIGAILTGVFVVKGLGGAGLVEGVTMGKQVGIQIVAVLSTLVYDAIVTLILLKIVDAFIGLRISEEAETEGLDIALHDERGYNL